MQPNDVKPKRTRAPRIARDFALPAPTGDWAADCQAGEAEAERVIAMLRMGADPHLGWIVRDTMRTREFAGVEAGFFGRLSREIANR